MENKNFKCLNKSCGVSYIDKSLGPCPVCGSEATKLEKKSGGIIIIISLLIIGLVGVGFYYFNSSNENNINTITSDSDETPEIEECDTSKLDLFDVRVNCNEQSLVLNVIGYDKNICGKSYYSVNNEKLVDTSFISYKKIKDDSVFTIQVYDENKRKLKSFYWTNNCYVPKIKCDSKNKLIKKFQNNFVEFLKNPLENSRKTKLKSYAKKIGFYNSSINVIFDGKKSKMKLNVLINRISKSKQFQKIKTQIIGDFKIVIEDDKSCSFKTASVKLKSS
jgi:hypothetical protein